jgi:hypothetical protein
MKANQTATKTAISQTSMSPAGAGALAGLSTALAIFRDLLSVRD